MVDDLITYVIVFQEPSLTLSFYRLFATQPL